MKREESYIAECYLNYNGATVDKFIITSKIDLSDVKIKDISLKEAYKNPYIKIPTNGVKQSIYLNGTLVIDVDDFPILRCPDFEMIIENGKEEKIYINSENIYCNIPETKRFNQGYTNGTNNIPYQLFVPNTNESAPLILFLHGHGDQGRDNFKPITSGLTPYSLTTDICQGVQKCYVLVPQAPALSKWTTSILEKIIEVIKSMVNTGQVDAKRIYITGCSMGGLGTFQAISHFANIFAAAVPFCPVLSCEFMKLDEEMQNVFKFENFIDNEKYIQAIADSKIPIWLFHAADDCVVPVETARKGYKFLSEAGCNIFYSEIPEELKMDHGVNSITAVNYKGDVEHPDIYTWLFKQVNKKTLF